MPGPLYHWLYNPPKKEFIVAELWHPRHQPITTYGTTRCYWYYDQRLDKHVLKCIIQEPRCSYRTQPLRLKLSEVCLEYLVKFYNAYDAIYVHTLNTTYPGYKGYLTIDFRSNVVCVGGKRPTDNKSMGELDHEIRCNVEIGEGEWAHVMICGRSRGPTTEFLVCVNGSCKRDTINAYWEFVYTFYLVYNAGWYIPHAPCLSSLRYRQEHYYAMARMWACYLSEDDYKQLWENVQQVI